jgi:HK97 family phage major capsid protein
VERAYAVLELKAIGDPGRRRIRGVASTPRPDRVGDILEPLGASFAAEMPLLLHHNTRAPVGVVRFDPPTPQGITFEADLPRVEEPGPVRDEVERAWTSIVHQLIRGVSIGYRALEGGIEVLASGGRRFLKTEILELSLVTVPAHQDATFATVKALDQAAFGRSPAPAPGPVVRRKPAMTTAEQIKQYENTRAAKAARLIDLMTIAGEKGETLDDAATTEYDDLDREVKAIDAHLVRLHEVARLEAARATPITPAADTPETAAAVRGGTPMITVKANVPKGTAFTRMVMATAAARGDRMLAIQYAQQWRDTTPEVETYMKAAVAAGSTTAATWALPLVPTAQRVTGEFLELLRPKTVLGKLSLRTVPFNTSVPAQTGGGTYGWVGEAKPKPLSALALATVSLGFAKIAGIVVITDELARLSSPSAEETVRNDMIAGVSAFMDAQFLDPAVAAVATVNPASITNGLTPIASSGTSGDNAKTDIKALIKAFLTANLSLENAALVMSESNAFALAVAMNPLGQALFPGFASTGGPILGIPVVTSQVAGTNVILLDQRGVLYADEGGTTIDVSKEASLQMDSAPTSPADATTVLVSMFQHNMIALRVERMCTWVRARATSVGYVSGAAYV